MKKIGLFILLAILASLLAPTVVAADGPWPKEASYTVVYAGKTYDLNAEGLRGFFRWVSYEGKSTGEIFIYNLYQSHGSQAYKKMWLTGGGVWFWEKIDPELGVFQKGTFQEWNLGTQWYHDFLIFW